MDYVQIKINDPTPANTFATDHPGECPICHHKIAPTLKYAMAQAKAPEIQATYRCTNTRCAKLFLAYFSNPYHNPRCGQTYELAATLPITQQRQDFADSIRVVSPQFVSIFNEAYAAEQLGLGEICGVGYRKSLEFLIKDYLIGHIPTDDPDRVEKTEQLKAKSLGNCIAQDISDQNIKVVAQRATWLGNDETHYVRKWTGKDVNDLKKLIALTVHHMESEALTAQALNDMPERR
jgi:hypothetical protein